MSVYTGDLRVVLNGDGTATVPGGDGDWEVRPQFGGWVAHHPQFGFASNGGDRHGSYTQLWDDRDAAIAGLIGPAQVPVGRGSVHRHGGDCVIEAVR